MFSCEIPNLKNICERVLLKNASFFSRAAGSHLTHLLTYATGGFTITTFKGLVSQVLFWLISQINDCSQIFRRTKIIHHAQEECLKKAKSGTNSCLQTTRKDNLNKLIFAHLNFNSIRNKFDFVADIIKDNIDIFMISETKVDDVFPDG